MSDAMEGATAPAVRVETADGPLALAETGGRKRVVYFYPKDDTPGCTTQAQQFTALAADFAAADTDVIGVSKDSVASHGKFAAKYALGIVLGSDPSGTAVEAFGAWVEKSMYGRKYMGIDRSTFLLNRDGAVARAWRRVKVPGHAAAVLEAARALP